MFCAGVTDAAELAEHAAERVPRIRPPGLREHVARPAERVVRLLEPELPEVARDGRLRDAAARVGERGEELELRADPLAGDDARDQPLALRFPEHALALHTPALLSL